MERFCPSCGAPKHEKGLCEACADTDSDKEVGIKLCPTRRFMLDGSWRGYKEPGDVIEAVVNYVFDDATPLKASHNVDRLRHDVGTSENVTVDLHGKDSSLIIHVDVTESPARKRQKKESKAATVQIRNTSKETRSYLHGVLEELRIDSSLISIAEDPGIDLVFGDVSEARAFANKVRSDRGGIIRGSRTLHTVDDMSSERVYRSTFLVRLVPFSPDDVVDDGSDAHHVTDVGERCRVVDLATGSAQRVDAADLMSVDVLNKSKVTVSETGGDLHVLHPETYQSVPALNPYEFDATPGQTVTVVQHGGRVILVND